MGSSTADILARLTLNASQFSSEGGRAFADLAVKAQTSARDLRDSFVQNLAEVNKLAVQTLQMPRTTGGSLDLTSEIASLREAAQAADQKAIAARELSQAFDRTAFDATGASEAVLREADALMIASRAATADAEALRTRAAQLERAQQELNGTASATARSTAEIEAARIAEAALAQSTERMLNALDPTRAAQQRYNAEIAEAKTLLDAGRITADQYGQAQERAALALRQVADAAGLAADRQRALWQEQARDARSEVLAARTQSGFQWRDAAGLSNKSARASAEVFEQAAAAERDMAAAADTLRSKLDPMFAAQKRFDQELAVAERLLASGVIGQREYAQAQQAARDTLYAHAQAVAGSTASQSAQELVIRRSIGTQGQQRTSLIMLGQQLQDFSVQVVSGQSVTVAFAQQIGQAAYAVQGMEGRLAGVASFLTSGWGIAATTGLVVLAPLVGKLLEQNDALDDAVKKLEKTAGETRVTAQAEDIFAGSAKGVIAAIDEQNAALRKQVTAQRDATAEAVKASEAEELKAVRIRETTVALLRQTEAEFASARSQTFGAAGGAGAGMAIGVYAGRLGEVQKQVAEAEAALAKARENVGTARVQLAIEQGKRAADPIKAINDAYDAQIQRLRETTDGTKSATDAIERQAKQIELNRTAALKTEQDKQAALKKTAELNRQVGRELSSNEAAAIVRGIGGQVNSADRSYARQKQLYDAWVSAGRPRNNPVAKPGTSAHERGNALDVQMSAGMTPAKLREAFQREGVALTKVFAEQGHWHIEWKKSGDAARGLAESVREAEKAQRELDTALDTVIGKFDPAAEAARAYVEQLAKIDALAQGGRITGEQRLDYTLRAKAQYNAARTSAANDNFRAIIGPEEVDGAIKAWQDGIAAAGEQMRDDAEKAGIRFGDQIRYAFGSAADLLGIRISGPLRTMLQPGGIEGQSGEAAKALVDGLRNSSLKISTESLDRLEKGISSALAGAAYGQLGGSVFASITGGKQNVLGSALGGVLGNEAGKALGGTIKEAVGGGLGKLLGGAAGPLGSIVGGIAGSIVGNLFRSTPKGSAGINVANGSIAATKASGNNKDATSQAASLAGSVAQGLTQIADQLGALITGTTDVQIGVYDGKWRVNDHGGAIGGVKGSGAISFDTQEQAISYAISDALKDGVLSGISNASLTILRSGQDLSAAISKAMMIEQIPKDLKAMLDPVGAAVDELNRKWAKTVAALNEGGASAEQMAQAQQLYDLQLAQVKNSTAAASQTLKDFLTSLKIGSNSPYALRDQEATALAALKPFLDQIGSGQAIDQSKYQAAAQSYLDIERQLYGSTQGYFDALDAVQAATNKAIAQIDNVTPIGAAVESPFVKATADSTAKTADAVAQGNEIAAQNAELLARLAEALERLADNGGTISSDFIGATRAFAA